VCGCPPASKEERQAAELLEAWLHIRLGAEDVYLGVAPLGEVEGFVVIAGGHRIHPHLHPPLSREESINTVLF